MAIDRFESATLTRVLLSRSAAAYAQYYPVMESHTLEYEQRPLIRPSQIDAILSLLDDPDPVVQSSIRARFLEIGEHAAPALRRAASDSTDELARRNAIEHLHEIGLRKFVDEIDEVIDAQPADLDIDLERGAFAIAYLRYPDLRIEDFSQQIDTMASLLDSRLRGADNGYLIVREMNHYLFDQLGFTGCRQDRESYYDPENSFLNRVMERRVGIPITLSVIYLLVAQRLRLPMYGIGFPARFLVKYRSLHDEFYIDPFNSGAIINYSDCRRFLREINVDYRPEYLEPTNNRRIVARMMRNLVDIYRRDDMAVTAALTRAIAELEGGEMPGFEEEEGGEEM